MSPLPDRLADRTSFIHDDDEAVNNFFNKYSGLDKIWRLHAYEENPDKLKKLCKSLGVDFEQSVPPLESYTTETDGHGQIYHRVYVTNRKGVYLDLQASKADAFNFPIDLKLINRTTFVKLGENIDKGYMASLRNE